MEGYELDRKMKALSERQHAVVGRHQLRELGANSKSIDHRAAGQVWSLVTPRVLVLRGSPRTLRQRCMVAVLDAGEGAAVSHHTAAHLYGLPGFELVAVHVSRQRGRSGNPPHVGTLHEPVVLVDRHRSVLDGIPITTPARTVFDLAGALPAGRGERALDNALSRKVVELEELRRVTIDLLRRGRTGSANMRRWLEARGADYIPPASGNEARFLAALIASGVGRLPHQQVQLGAGDDLWQVDFYDRPESLITEIDGDLGHTSELDKKADARRNALYRAAGFEVQRFDEHELKVDPGDVVRRYLALRRARSRAIGA